MLRYYKITDKNGYSFRKSTGGFNTEWKVGEVTRHGRLGKYPIQKGNPRSYLSVTTDPSEIPGLPYFEKASDLRLFEVRPAGSRVYKPTASLEYPAKRISLEWYVKEELDIDLLFGDDPENTKLAFDIASTLSSYFYIRHSSSLTDNPVYTKYKHRHTHVTRYHTSKIVYRSYDRSSVFQRMEMYLRNQPQFLAYVTGSFFRNSITEDEAKYLMKGWDVVKNDWLGSKEIFNNWFANYCRLDWVSRGVSLTPKGNQVHRSAQIAKEQECFPGMES